MKKLVLLFAFLLLALSFTTNASAAALPAGTLLTIDNGFNGAVSYFTLITSTSGTATNFIHSTNAGGSKSPESLDGGIRLLTIQAAGTGSHAGLPTTTDTGPIDAPWSFFGNTGHHFQPNGTISADPVAGTITMLGGWFLKWNGDFTLNLGGDPMNFGDTGIGTFIVSGTNYTVDYTTHYFISLSSGGGTYGLHLEGRIFPAAVPEPASILLLGSGLAGLLGIFRRKE